MNFNQLASELLIRSETLCREWFPEGKRHGSEFRIGDLSGAAGESLSINLNTGVWMDFATGETGGDLISLYAASHGITQGDAFRRLSNGSAPDCLSRPALPKRPPPASPDIIMPVPEQAGMPSMRHHGHGNPVAHWKYRDAGGRLLGIVARYEPGGRKQIVPWVYSASGWIPKQFPEPRPLYGLDRLAAKTKAQVLIVEGEKAADAAHAMIGNQMAVVSWPGGAQALRKADWLVLAGRKVLLWPDADEPGIEAMQKLAEILVPICENVKAISVEGYSDGWDAADCGFSEPEFIKWAKARVGARRLELPPAADAWGEPVDLFRAAPIPELQREWLPPVIADYAFDQADIVGTDPALIALSCIVACAGAIHDGIQVQPARHNHGWRESARLWGAIVGDPSIKKSPAVSRAVSRLKKIDIGLAEQEGKAKAKHAIDMRIYEKAEKAYADAISKGEHATLPDKPELPLIERLIVEDTTVEALSSILQTNPRGILCLADELSGWFGAMDAYKQGAGGKDRANWLEIYNGGPRRVDRIGRGSFLVPNWSACMLGGIQPDTMRKVAANMPADGLLQRFMLVVGKAGRAGDDRVPDLEAQDSYRTTVDQIFSLQPCEEPIKLSPEAKGHHDEIVAFAYRAIELGCLPAGLMSHLGKWEGLAPRLMLTFHIIEAASMRVYPPEFISGATAARVRGFMIEFLFRHALAFYADILGDNGYTDAVRWVGGYILAHGKTTLQNRELTQSYGWWKSAKDWERTVVIQRLIDFSWLLPARPETDRFKALPTQLAVNPQVFERFSGQAAHEKLKRDAARALILRDSATPPTFSNND